MRKVSSATLRLIAVGLLALQMLGVSAQPVGKRADAAGPNETHFYGVVLGRPITGMQECPLDPATHKYDVNPQTNQQACYIRAVPASKAPLRNETVTVIPKADERPALGGEFGNLFRVSLLNGNAEQVGILTGGVPTQEMNYMWLKAYFGDTSVDLTVHGARTPAGKEVNVFEATWERPKQVRVEFAAATSEDNLNRGVVAISTKRWRDHEAKQ